jgi:hypothetical protein
VQRTMTRVSVARPCGAHRLCAPLLALLVLLAATPSARASEYPTVSNAQDRTALLSAVVDEMRLKRSASDRRYFADGVWYGVGSACWRCRIGPGIGAAALVPQRPDLLPVAVLTMDRGIALHQKPDGSFGDPLDTAWFADAIGTTYLLLEPYIDQPTAARWKGAVARAADYLIGTGHLSYYVNGNINLSITQAMWLAARLTGDARFGQAYETSWAFTLAPPQTQWPGYGLRWLTAPTRPDWADGSGYLGEAGNGAPGFDPEYVQVQLDVAASLYVLSRDPRVLTLMNPLINSLLTRVDGTSALDSRGGTRRNGRVPFLTAALGLLAQSGRTDLASLLPAQFARARTDYAFVLGTTTDDYEPGFYGGVGSWLAVPVMDLRYRGVTVAPPQVAAAPPAPATKTVLKRARTVRCHTRSQRQTRTCRARARARAKAHRRRAARRAAERRGHAHRHHRRKAANRT